MASSFLTIFGFAIMAFIVVVGLVILFGSRPDKEIAKLGVTLFALELLRFVERNTHPSTLTNVLLQSSGSLSHAALYGTHFACNCSWPTAESLKEADPSEPRLLRTLQGRIILKDTEILRRHLSLLGEDLTRAYVLRFQIDSDPSPARASRLKHGAFVRLELFDASEVTTIYSVEKLLFASDGYGKHHDQVLESIFATLCASVAQDAQAKPAR